MQRLLSAHGVAVDATASKEPGQTDACRQADVQSWSSSVASQMSDMDSAWWLCSVQILAYIFLCSLQNASLPSAFTASTECS